MSNIYKCRSPWILHNFTSVVEPVVAIFNWIYLICAYFVCIYSTNDSRNTIIWTQCISIHSTIYGVISKWIEIVRRVVVVVVVALLVNMDSMILGASNLSLFTHVIKAIANSICTQIFDNIVLFNEFDCWKEKIKLRLLSVFFCCCCCCWNYCVWNTHSCFDLLILKFKICCCHCDN